MDEVKFLFHSVLQKSLDVVIRFRRDLVCIGKCIGYTLTIFFTPCHALVWVFCVFVFLYLWRVSPTGIRCSSIHVQIITEVSVGMAYHKAIRLVHIHGVHGFVLSFKDDTANESPCIVKFMENHVKDRVTCQRSLRSIVFRSVLCRFSVWDDVRVNNVLKRWLWIRNCCFP